MPDQMTLCFHRFHILAFVLLHEEVSVKAVAGCVLIGEGTLVMVL